MEKIELSAPDILFSFYLEHGSFMLQSPGIDLRSGGLGIRYWEKNSHKNSPFKHWEVINGSTSFAAHGSGPGATLAARAGGEIEAAVRFELDIARRAVLWKVWLTNAGVQTLELDQIYLLDTAFDEGQLKFEGSTDIENWGFYSNGWQSWSYSGSYAAGSKMRSSRLGLLQYPMIFNPGTPLPGGKGQFSSDFFSVIGDRRSRRGFVLGFLSQLQQFGSVQADFSRSPEIRIWANCDRILLQPGASIETDWAIWMPVDLNDPAALDGYLDASAEEVQMIVPRSSPVGWCSWYHFYTRVTAADIRQNLTAFEENRTKLPLELVQIDDGFEAQVGDWFSFKQEFSEGMKILADEIRSRGFVPGLWLAPFIVHPNSQLAKTHPDWLLKTRAGRSANAGFGWNALTAGLDLTVPEALDYACQVVRTAVHEWGYPYLKLDFLYASAIEALPSDRSLTRAQILRRGFEALREAAGPDAFLLGCGAPLGTAQGVMQAMRIGPDVSGYWKPQVPLLPWFFYEEPSFPSARNSIHAILTRAMLHGKWWINDPDCLLVRDTIKLSVDEVKTLASAIAMTGGALLISDDLPTLPDERLRIAQALLPVIGKRPLVLDWFDSPTPTRLRLDLNGPVGDWSLLTWFNWADQPVDFMLNLEDFGLPRRAAWLRSFWDGRIYEIEADQTLKIAQVPAHAALCLAVRWKEPNKTQYLGGSLHFSQGQEIATWAESDGGVNFTIDLQREFDGEIALSVPREIRSILVGGEPAEYRTLDQGRIALKVHGSEPIEIQLENL